MIGIQTATLSDQKTVFIDNTSCLNCFDFKKDTNQQTNCALHLGAYLAAFLTNLSECSHHTRV